jgi:transposase
MQQLSIRLRKRGATPRYSDFFKRKVVWEFEAGGITKEQLQKKYGIRGHSTVLKWCRKYGKFDGSKKTITAVKIVKDPRQQRIKELEKKLKEAEIKLKVYDKLIEVTNRELDADIIKKSRPSCPGACGRKASKCVNCVPAARL